MALFYLPFRLTFVFTVLLVSLCTYKKDAKCCVPTFFCTSLLLPSLTVALSVLDYYWGSSNTTSCSSSRGFLFLLRPLQAPEPLQPRPSWLTIPRLQDSAFSSTLWGWEGVCVGRRGLSCSSVAPMGLRGILLSSRVASAESVRWKCLSTYTGFFISK